MKTTIIATGKLKERHWREACEDYAKRLSASTKLTVTEVAEDGVLRVLPERAWIVALAISGTQRSSEELSAHLEELKLRGQSHLCFVIGGPDGLAPEVLARADEQLSFGPITLPHDLARVVLLEQLYRAATIAAGSPYHK